MIEKICVEYKMYVCPCLQKTHNANPEPFLVVAPLPPFIGADSTDSFGSGAESWIDLQSGQLTA